MITRILKSAITFFNAAKSEVTYWKQIEELQIELEQTGDALSSAKENEENIARENFELRIENSELKEEVQLSKDSYTSLLKDYYLMMDKHRNFKRETYAQLESLGVSNVV